MGAEIKEESKKKATKKVKKSATIPVNGAALRKVIEVPEPIRALASKLGNCKTIKMARVPVKKA